MSAEVYETGESPASGVDPAAAGPSEVDPERRKILTAVTTAVGVVGAGFAAVPFVESWLPSASALAGGAPVEIDLTGLGPGQIMTTEWRKKPVWVLHRTAAQIAVLPSLNSQLKDPMSKEPQQPTALPNWNPVQRSVKPEFWVAVGICTHLGCIPQYKPEPGSVDASWRGGFHCPCHGSRYDLSGRVMDGSPAPLNLPVIPYYYKTDSIIVAGDLADGSDLSWAPSVW
ncbi:MAG: ubiquinol-cytochrome c reductase iron-sulfur subunit [Steroidobacteraceae bacterium]